MVLSSVVLAAFGATAASATPAAVNPPAPTGTITTASNGTVTLNVTGSWSWPVGNKAGDIKATNAKKCGAYVGVGWGVVWNDANDAGYTLKYGSVAPELVGSTTAVNGNTVDESVHYNAANPCGSFSTSAITGQWTDQHTYANAASVPTSICVVSYALKGTPASKPKHYLVDKNSHNSFHTAVKAGLGASWPTSSACFDPTILKVSPTIVTTATNAQVGSAITDSAALSGTATAVTSNASTVSGTISFKLYGPSDTGCTSTPVFTSTAMPVSGNGTYGPASFVPTQGAGTYRWIATYSGDAADNGATETCGATGETSTVTAAPATTTSNPPTSPSSSTPVVTASTPTPSAPVTAAISGATTVHTGEPWAGSKPFEVALIAFGLSLMGLGLVQRRRLAVRKHADHGAVPGD
ncbi:MAG TPA: hypothetical protein VN799_10740 [Acidimicrobiales bacterium]|nr:hypothetical protein [Acidimicrobiales bacterium]